MPRASRYLVEGYTYHLTHRCHDKRFLLKFREERDAYREWLRTAVKRHGVAVYAYSITKNHVHVVAHAHDRESIAALMHLPSSAVARRLNRRKGHEGSVWEHPYQCTMIQDGRHLLNCLRYVDLNMVRAGVVQHPRHWKWCGYDELVGSRKRYRILNVERLLQSLGLDDRQALARLHADGIEDLISRDRLGRQAFWSESLAVGSRDYVERVKKTHGHRTRFKEERLPAGGEPATWTVREARNRYGTDSGSELAL